MRIVVTGASGFVGSNAAADLTARHDVLGLTFQTRGAFPFPCERVDLTCDEPLSSHLHAWKPDVIVHSAAMSRVLECERDPNRAHAVNVEATGRLVRLAERLHAKLIFISSDQVYSGGKGGYRESDEPAPVGRYGRTKLEAERLVLNSAARHLVLRSNSVVGNGIGWGESFSMRVVGAARRGEPIPLFFDQYRSPIHVRTLVRVIEIACLSEISGLLNVGGLKRLSRLEAGCIALRAAGISPERVESVSYLSHSGAEFMTRDTSYDISRLRQLMPDVGIQPLDEVLSEDFSTDPKKHENF